MRFYQLNDKDSMELPVTFGMCSTRRLEIRDFPQMAHLLIGGVTGAGKSMFLHSFICSLVKVHSPEKVRFVLMDSKRVEFGVYAKLPHLYAPVVHEPERGATMVKHVTAEMNRRFSLFGARGCRNIAAFNTTCEGTRLPYLIVVIDELSDFMTGSGNDFEFMASWLAVNGRSAGIHLVMATSRFDERFRSSSLVHNIHGRLAFRVFQKADSLSLLDEYGAEKLIGRGDALLKDTDGKTNRLQAPYVSDDAIRLIVDSAIARYPGRQFADGIASSTDPKEDCESMYERALYVVRMTRRASTSWLQRQMRIGYNDAGHIMSLLEERGIIGPASDKGPREILIDDNSGDE